MTTRLLQDADERVPRAQDAEVAVLGSILVASVGDGQDPMSAVLKVIEVKLHSSDGGIARTYKFHDCLPVTYRFSDIQTDADQASSETLTCQIGRIEFEAN